MQISEVPPQRGIDFYRGRPLPKALELRGEMGFGKSCVCVTVAFEQLELEVCHLDLKLSNHVHSPPFP